LKQTEGASPPAKPRFVVRPANASAVSDRANQFESVDQNFKYFRITEHRQCLNYQFELHNHLNGIL
jgi:hypothetical protein